MRKVRVRWIGATLLWGVVAPLAADDFAFRLHVVNPDSTYSACAVIDVNRDGRLDIVGGGWWYEAPDWKRHFVREVEFIRGRYDGYSHLPLDVDGDGWLDFVSANYRSQKLYWIEHPGKELGPWTLNLIEKPGPMETARLVDVDGDGHLDVLPNGVRFAAWWELRRPTADSGSASSGESFQWVRHDLPGEVAGHGVGFGDVNGDGRGDVIGPRGWLEAPEERRVEKWTWHGEFDLGPDASIPILVLDVDGDGDSDLLWGRGHRFGLYWLEQRGGVPDGGSDTKREWTRHAIDTEFSQYHSLLLADLDGDGADEVIAGRRYMGHDGRDPGEYDPLAICAYQFNAESRTWRRSLLSYGGGAGFGVDPKVIDLDGDGDLDLIGPGRSRLVWLENLRLGSRGDPGGTSGTPASPTYENHKQLLVVRDGAGSERAVKTQADWFLRRAHIARGLERAMGELPGPERRCPLDVEVLEEAETPHYLRRKITYSSEPGDRVPAWLLIPKDVEGKAPAMLCLHQTNKPGKDSPAALAGRATLHYAHELAERGFVCLAPDYPSFGEYEYDFAKARERYASGSMKAIWNNIRAVDLLETLPEVAVDRIGVIGHSLGGHNALFTAVFERRLRAVVTSCGFTAFHRYYGGKLAGWTSDRYMPRIRDLYGNDPDRVPFDFHEVIAAIAPRALFVCAPERDSNFDVTGVREVIAAASGVYELLEARGRLRVEYPDKEHDFPDAERHAAYAWLAEQLRG